MKIKLTVVNFFVSILFLLPFFTHSQTDTKQKLTSALNNYFLLERENIHLNLNKKTFFTNEEIWLKGYVLNRKLNVPFFNTTNVHLSLINESGDIIADKLIFANNGSFSANFKLDKTIPTGIYYIQAYTNWMNNFAEDESGIAKLNIINEDENFIPDFEAADYTSTSINIHPEGGNFIAGINNILGISIIDCNQKPIMATQGEIKNSKGEIIKTISVNKFGYGKFDLFGDNDTYTISFIVDGIKKETILPKPVISGFGLEVNNYSLANKTVVKVKSNPTTLKSLAGKQLYVIAHQDERMSVFEISFANDSTEKELVFSTDYLFAGINFIRVVDSDLNLLAERAVFKFPADNYDLTFLPAKINRETINFLGTSSLVNANLSVSVLPENSIVAVNSSIKEGFLLNNYLSVKLSGTDYYFENPSKAKNYELDLALLNQKEIKYKWNEVLNNPLEKKHDFEFGLTLQGTLNATLSANDKYAVQLFSLKNWLNETTKIDDKNQFYFKNLVVSDSSWVNFTLLRMPERKPLSTSFTTKILNNKVKFKNSYIPKQRCNKIFKPIDSSLTAMPEFSKDAIILENVEIKSAKPVLKYQNRFGNAVLRGYKIVPENNGMDVLDFIRNNGFDVNKYSPDVEIYGRSRTTINGQRSTPAIFIDGMRIMTFQELWQMRMEDIDEIYINAHAIFPSVNNNIGIIKIYRKRGASGPSKEYQNKAETFLITDGFDKIKTFENSTHLNTFGPHFLNFGIIDWLHTLLIRNGKFQFDIPNTNTQTIKVKIEGFTNEGVLISKTQTFTIKK